MENAPDQHSRHLYEEEAARIAEIQKGILAISQNEKPYDVFICYKETDEHGQRTRDSQWAQEVYYGLTEQGYKVFFSRITLEDKLGQEYKDWNTNGGNNTLDKVFLLSYTEANKYLEVHHINVSGADKNTKSRVTPTAYAITHGAYSDNNNKTADGQAAGWWWLRSPGSDQNSTACVLAGGSLMDGYVNNNSAVILPALWLNLNSDIF